MSDTAHKLTTTDEDIDSLNGIGAFKEQPYKRPTFLNTIDEIFALQGASEEIKEALTDLVNNPAKLDHTSTVAIIANAIPDEGLAAGKTIRMIANTAIASAKENPVFNDGAGKFIIKSAQKGINNATDEELVLGAQSFLREKGNPDLAEKIGDGNLSKTDALELFAALGGTLSKNHNPEISQRTLKSTQNALIGSGISDPETMDNLAVLEHFLDKGFKEDPEGTQKFLDKLPPVQVNFSTAAPSGDQSYIEDETKEMDGAWILPMDETSTPNQKQEIDMVKPF